MIVYDLDVLRRAVFPAKADPPLLIDANAVLPRPIALELLQSIPGWYPQFIESDRGIEQQQFAKHHAPQRGRKTPHWLAIKEPLTIAIGETGDHVDIVTLDDNNVKRYATV